MYTVRPLEYVFIGNCDERERERMENKLFEKKECISFHFDYFWFLLFVFVCVCVPVSCESGHRRNKIVHKKLQNQFFCSRTDSNIMYYYDSAQNNFGEMYSVQSWGEYFILYEYLKNENYSLLY